MNWARDLINTPANEMGPQELEDAARTLAVGQGAEMLVVRDEQLQRDYPLIAAVGGGSSRAPRLIDCRWRRPGLPRVTLVGKGVCFDTGGLDLKSSASMLLMKKDMGGAACVLGLARLLLTFRYLSSCAYSSRRSRTVSAAAPIGRVTCGARARVCGRDRQYGCRGPPGSGGCTGGRRRGAPPICSSTWPR